MTFRSGGKRDRKMRTKHILSLLLTLLLLLLLFSEWKFLRIDKIRVSFYCIHNWFEKHVLSWQIIPPHILLLRLSRWQRFHSAFECVHSNQHNPYFEYLLRQSRSCLFYVSKSIKYWHMPKNGSYFHFVASISSTFSEHINFAFTAYLHLLVFIFVHQRPYCLPLSHVKKIR